MKKIIAKTTILALVAAFSITDAFASRSSHLKLNIPTSTEKVNSNHSEFNLNELISSYTSWGISPNSTSSINLEKAWKIYNKKKKDVVVAVIDTGIDPEHPFIKENLYLPNGVVSKYNYGMDFSKNARSMLKPIDNHGHGTHIAGIIKSVFPNVKLLILKYYNKKASGQENLNSTIDALRYAVKQNVDIINYSGGGAEQSPEELKILKQAEKKGIIVVAAAGNEESNIDLRQKAYYPASYGLNNIISVTTHDRNLRIHHSSNWGRKTVDIAAPGNNIKSSYPLKFGRSAYLTGTSQSTAFVSGAVALIKSLYPQANYKQIKEIIVSSGKIEKTLFGKTKTGARLDVEHALLFAKKLFKTATPKTIRRNIATEEKKENKKTQIKTKKSNSIIFRLKQIKEA